MSILARAASDYGIAHCPNTALEHHLFIKVVLAYVALAIQLCAQEHRGTTLTAKKAQEIVRERQLDEHVTSATADLR